MQPTNLTKPLTSLTSALLSLLLLVVFATAPAARAQSYTPQTPAPAELRLVDQDWAVPTDAQAQAPQARLQSDPVYEEPAAVPSGVSLPGTNVSSDLFVLGLAAFTGAFLGGMLAGSICCGVFFIYYY